MWRRELEKKELRGHEDAEEGWLQEPLQTENFIDRSAVRCAEGVLDGDLTEGKLLELYLAGFWAQVAVRCAEGVLEGDLAEGKLLELYLVEGRRLDFAELARRPGLRGAQCATDCDGQARRGVLAVTQVGSC